MSRLIDTGEVKALFRQLVKAAGGVEACAAELGISFQRVSHLQNPSNSDEPTFRQIRCLETVVGQAIVTGAHVRAVEGEADEKLRDAVVGAVMATAEVMTAVHQMDADGHRDEAEVRDVQTRALRALTEAQEAHSAASQLKAGPVH